MTISEIYNEHIDRVHGFFYVKTLDQMLAEDLSSQTFITLLKRMKDKDVVIKNSSTYLSGIMRNVWLEYLREKYKRNVVSIENIEDFAVYVDDVVERANSEGLENFAQQYIDKLPDKQKSILTMRLLEKKTLQEISNSLGKDMNYVRTTQKRGIAKLREMLSSETAGGTT